MAAFKENLTSYIRTTEKVVNQVQDLIIKIVSYRER